MEYLKVNAVDYQNCLEPIAHFKTAAIPFHHEKEQMGIDKFRYLKHYFQIEMLHLSIFVT